MIDMKICTSVLTRAVVAAGALLQVGTATPVRAAEPTENLAAGASLLQPMTPVSHETAEPAAEALNSPPSVRQETLALYATTIPG